MGGGVMWMSPKLMPARAGVARASSRQAAARPSGRAASVMMHLGDLHVGGQVQSGFLDSGQQFADDREGIDLIEPRLVVEDQAVIEYGGGYGLNILEAGGRPAFEEGAR